METLLGRLQTTRTTETTSIAWIELSQDDRVNFEAIIWKRSQTIGTIGTITFITVIENKFSLDGTEVNKKKINNIKIFAQRMGAIRKVFEIRESP